MLPFIHQSLQSESSWQDKKVLFYSIYSLGSLPAVLTSSAWVGPEMQLEVARILEVAYLGTTAHPRSKFL